MLPTCYGLVTYFVGYISMFILSNKNIITNKERRNTYLYNANDVDKNNHLHVKSLNYQGTIELISNEIPTVFH